MNVLKTELHSGGVHPLIFGAFGEANIETTELIQNCALLAAASEGNSDVSVLDNTLQKGTAYNVYLTQFNQVVGVSETKTAAQVKIRRTTYIRLLNEEAVLAEK